MTDVLETVEYWLTDPSGTVLRVTDAKFSNVANQGVKWSCGLSAVRAIDWSDTDEWLLHVHSVAGLFEDWTSMPLVALEPDTDTFGGQGTMRIGGTDKTSYLLTAEGLTMPAFKDAMANTVINAIAAKAGITVRYLTTTALSSMRMQWFFVQGAEETLGSHIINMLHKTACNFRIGADGAMEIFPVHYDVPYTGLVLGRARRSPRLGNKFSQIVAQKYSQQSTEFIFRAEKDGEQGGDVGPVGLLGSSINAVDASTQGLAWYAAFFSGPDGTGSLVALFELDPTEFTGGGLGGSLTFPTPDGSLTAQSVVWGVKKSTGIDTVNAGLYVTGQPPNDFDYHSSFKAKYPDIDSSTRQRKKLVATPLWPTLDFVTANSIHRDMLWEANKQSDTVERDIRFDPHVLPCGTLGADSDAPAARFDTSSFSLKDSEIKHSLSGFVVPW